MPVTRATVCTRIGARNSSAPTATAAIPIAVRSGVDSLDTPLRIRAVAPRSEPGIPSFNESPFNSDPFAAGSATAADA